MRTGVRVRAVLPHLITSQEPQSTKSYACRHSKFSVPPLTPFNKTSATPGAFMTGIETNRTRAEEIAEKKTRKNKYASPDQLKLDSIFKKI